MLSFRCGILNQQGKADTVESFHFFSILNGLLNAYPKPCWFKFRLAYFSVKERRRMLSCRCRILNQQEKADTVEFLHFFPILNGFLNAYPKPCWFKFHLAHFSAKERRRMLSCRCRILNQQEKADTVEFLHFFSILNGFLNAYPNSCWDKFNLGLFSLNQRHRMLIYRCRILNQQEKADTVEFLHFFPILNGFLNAYPK